MERRVETRVAEDTDQKDNWMVHWLRLLSDGQVMRQRHTKGEEKVGPLIFFL